MENIADTNITIEYIVSIYGRMVTSICRRMIQNEETVKDTVQEIWLEVTRSLPSYRSDSKISTWLYVIASRVVMKQARKEKLYSTKFLSDYYHGETLDIPYEEDFDKQLWVREMCDKCLTGVLHCLDNESRLAYILRDVAKLPYGEISGILEKDELAVRKIISRSRNKLRNFLNDECVINNPESACKCRMSKWVKEINLSQEYQKLKESVHRINLFKASEILLPKKNYWLNQI